MKNEIKIAVRAYPVVMKDTRTGEVKDDTIVLEKSRLHAGAMFDLGDEDIICRIYNRQGYRVLEIGKPDKREISLNLEIAYAACIKMEQLQAFGKAHADAQPDNQEADGFDK